MWPKDEGLIGDSSVVPLPAPVAHDASGGDDLDLAPGAGGASCGVPRGGWLAPGHDVGTVPGEG